LYNFFTPGCWGKIPASPDRARAAGRFGTQAVAQAQERYGRRLQTVGRALGEVRMAIKDLRAMPSDEGT